MHIWELQQQDKNLLALHNKYSDNYIKLKLGNNIDDIICYKKDPTQYNWTVALPEEMVLDTVKWFHQVTGHPMQDRLHDTLKQHYHHHLMMIH